MQMIFIAIDFLSAKISTHPDNAAAIGKNDACPVRAVSATERTLSPSKRAMSAGQRRVSVSKRALLASGRRMSISRRALSLTKRAMSATGRTLSLARRALYASHSHQVCIRSDARKCRYPTSGHLAANAFLPVSHHSFCAFCGESGDHFPNLFFSAASFSSIVISGSRCCGRCGRG